MTVKFWGVEDAAQVEEVAKAIYDARPLADVAWEHIHDPIRDNFRKQARAAIAALTVTPQEAAPDWEGFGRAMLEHWPVRDVDGAELFDLSLKHGLIAEVPGGYDPEQHIDAEGISPEKGDPWYEYTFREDSQ